MILPPILFLFYSNRSCSLRLRQFQFGRIAILSHLAHLAFFLLRRKFIQPGDSSRRLLIRHLEFLARGVESVGAPLVSTPLPLPYSIAPQSPPRIHHRLAQYIRHRYRRYRPGELHRPGAATAPAPTTTPGPQMATLSMMPLILIIEPSNEDESFFSMAEEKAAGEFSNSDQGSDMASTTTPDAHVSHDSFHAEEPVARVPKSALLAVSWAVCSIGLHLFCPSGIGYYTNKGTEVKLAIPVLLGYSLILSECLCAGPRIMFVEMLLAIW